MCAKLYAYFDIDPRHTRVVSLLDSGHVARENNGRSRACRRDESGRKDSIRNARVTHLLWFVNRLGIGSDMAYLALHAYWGGGGGWKHTNMYQPAVAWVGPDSDPVLDLDQVVTWIRLESEPVVFRFTPPTHSAPDYTPFSKHLMFPYRPIAYMNNVTRQIVHIDLGIGFHIGYIKSRSI